MTGRVVRMALAALAAVTAAGTATHVAGSPPARAADGTPRIAYTCRYQLCLADADGSDERRIVMGTEPTVTVAPQWSPDGRRVAFLCFWDGDWPPVRDQVTFDGTTYERYSGGDLCTARADGSHARRITRAVPGAVGLTWSPDGSHLAFRTDRLRAAATSSDVPPESTAGIYTVRPDGSDLHQLTVGLGDDFPAWSPDGTRIAFSRKTGPGAAVIAVMGADGSGVRVVTAPTGGWDIAPAWSPDGNRLAFTRRTVDDTVQTWAMDADGGDARQLTESAIVRPEGESVMVDVTPEWSPDGRHLLVSLGVYDRLAVAVVDAATGRRRVVSPETGHPDSVGAFDATFSSDGRVIVFVTDDVRGDYGKFDVYAVTTDGTDLRRITDDDTEHYGPVLQPTPRR